jgi:hypothetical protein
VGSFAAFGTEVSAVAGKGRGFWDVVPVGMTIGLFSDVEAMENQQVPVLGRKNCLPDEGINQIVFQV